MVSTTLRTNAQRLVAQSVLGFIVHPELSLRNPYIVDSSGTAHIVPGTGGITYNVAVGDSALDFVGDHVEPGVSITQETKGKESSSLGGLCILACIGNEARVVSGAASAAKGVVTGKHGGVEHVIIDFPSSTLEKLVVGDRIQLRAFGQGLKLKDFPDIHVMNLAPRLLGKLGILQQNGQIIVPVTRVIPASIMGSGIGSRHSFRGDYDIQLSDKEIVQKYALQNLRLGDVIAVSDADCSFGRSFRMGAMTVGVVVHGSCITSGHGPGVTVIMTTARKLIVPKIVDGANIANYLGIRMERRARPMGQRRKRR